MTILGLCFDGPGHGVAAHHDPILVLISYIIAVFASFTALEMVERLRSSHGFARRFWHVAAAVALGGGVWSMHFVGMLAFKIPLAQAYDPVLTAVSGLIAIAAVAIGLEAFEHSVTWRRIALAGLFVGLGVAVMHYCGMSALRVPGHIYYKPGLFVLSVLIAVAAATVALWLAHTLRSTWQRGLAALVMALAICGMHYTGMAATVIVAEPHAPHTLDGLVHADDMALAVVLGVALVFGLGLICAFVDRRLEQNAIEEAGRLRVLNTELAERTQALTLALADLDNARRAEAANRAKSELLSSMSHELRTPLNAIMGFAQVMQLNRQREPLTPRQDEWLGYIVSNGNHLVTLIEAVLDLANLDGVEASMAIGPLDVAAVLGEVGDGFAGQAAQAGVTLVRDIDGPRSCRVAADPARLKQCLSSLLCNAILYHRPGGEVRLSIRALGERVEVAIADNGPGISADQLPNLFQPFNRLGREGGAILGAGVGLTIGKRLIEAMGGLLRVESSEGEGSTFTVILPAAARDAAPAHEEAA